MKLLRMIILLSLFSCIVMGSAASSKTVFVSILPQKYFVEYIGGDAVQVEVMIPPNHSPATYAPLPTQMRALSHADLFLSIGVPSEKGWLPKVQKLNKTILLVDQGKDIDRKPISRYDGLVLKHSHNHHHGHDHHDEMMDPHIWLSPVLMQKQVDSIAQALVQIMPDRKAVFLKNAASLQIKLKNLSMNISNQLKHADSKSMMVFHPSWGYFCDEFGLKQIPVEISGKSPTPKTLMKILDYAKKHKVKSIYVQPQFSRKMAQVIAGHIGAKVVVLDPLAEDYFANLMKIASTLSGEKK